MGFSLMPLETNTVVWASAGTGKTRKLVEVYLELLDRGIDPLRIVAVTFTERAAAEMRDRIRTALEARQGQWSKTISILAAAPISTIHGFCGILLREHGIELGIDPSFSILDEQRSLDLSREAARETIRQEIRNGSEDVEDLFRDFGLNGFVETLVSIGYWLNSLGRDASWLQARVQDQRRAAVELEREIGDEIRKYGGSPDKIGELADELAIEMIFERCSPGSAKSPEFRLRHVCPESRSFSSNNSGQKSARPTRWTSMICCSASGTC